MWRETPASRSELRQDHDPNTDGQIVGSPVAELIAEFIADRIAELMAGGTEAVIGGDIDASSPCSSSAVSARIDGAGCSFPVADQSEHYVSQAQSRCLVIEKNG